MAAHLRIEPLARTHAIEDFDCGREPLNRFLIRHALQSQQADASRTYVAVEGDRVVGYFTLVFGEVARVAAPPRVGRGLSRHPIPIMVLARLAVVVDRQGCGLGAGLLKDAILRTLQAADIAGLRAFVVHAKDEVSRQFYERFDFLASPTDPLHLFLLMKDLRLIVGTLS
ncbi:MAG: GNAT family N-acetyltransferase [Planctomycetia bacterium]